MLKKGICIFSAALIFVLFSVSALCLEESDLSASSAVLYCAETGEVLFEKNGDERRSMASTTKIMTSLIALEQNTPDRKVKITSEMVNVEGSSSGLRENDEVRLEDLVYCMLLESGNEAANAAALALGGSFEEFASLMNAKANEIGMTDTSFVTPSGLDDENHYTTARDMALLASYAVGNRSFVKICSSQKYTLSFFNSDKTITLYNHNRLLSEYDGCIGVKTGFTKKSGRCLVSAAVRDSLTLTAVTLNAPDDWNDHRKMLDYGFEVMTGDEIVGDFSSYSVRVVGSDVKSVGVTGEKCAAALHAGENADSAEVKVCLEKFLYAPVKKGDTIGYAVYYLNGRELCRTPLTASGDAERKEKEKNNFFDRFYSLFNG